MPARCGHHFNEHNQLTKNRSMKIPTRIHTLLADKDQVARCVAGKLLTCATGAGLTVADKVVIENVLPQTAAKEHGLRTLIHAVTQSYSFLNK